MKKYRKWFAFAGIWIGIIGLNLAAWCSAAFCDFYVETIFPIWVQTYGRLTGLVPFSVGEWLLYLAVLYLAVNVILILPAVLLRKRKAGKMLRRELSVVPWFLTIVCVIMTLNCTILYHCSPIERQFTAGSPAEASLERLIELRERIVTSCNALSGVMPRDEQGHIICSEENGTDAASMKKEAIAAMRGISSEFPRLAGYYPNPKPLAASWFFCQQYMCGYYFPFSMEANYNDMMYIMNIPYTMCHELSHLKGYIYEDEANFLAYLACVESGNDLFVYSGYLGVLYYVDEDVVEALAAAGEPERYQQLTAISDQVILDNRFLTPEAWEEVEQTSFLDTQMVSKISDDFLETNLTLNGVSEGTISYSRVVELLLLYESSRETPAGQ